MPLARQGTSKQASIKPTGDWLSELIDWNQRQTLELHGERRNKTQSAGVISGLDGLDPLTGNAGEATIERWIPLDSFGA